MERHSDEPLTDIADRVMAEVEADQDALMEATPLPVEDENLTTNALKIVDPESAHFYPTIAQRREEAEIPEHIQAKNLVGKRFTIARKVKQPAALPETGEVRDGFFCACLDLESKKPFTTWFGQTALIRDLGQISVPVVVTLVKHGRTYRFE